MSGKTKKTRMGRPPLAPEKRRRPSMGFRPTPEIRRNLEEVAKMSGLSLTQEVERRLERSFQVDSTAQYLFGFTPDTLIAIRCLGDAIAMIESETGHKWREDWNTCRRVEAAFSEMLDLFGPEQPPESQLGKEDRLKAESTEETNRILGRQAVIKAFQGQLSELMSGLRARSAEADQEEKATKKTEPQGR